MNSHLFVLKRFIIFLELEKGADITVKDFTNLIHSKDIQRISKALDDILQDIPPYHYEFRIITKNKKEKYLFCKLNISFDEAGSPEQIWGTISDITQNRKLEEELERKNQEIKLINHKIFNANQDWEIEKSQLVK
jgi:hypothetical protein